VNQPSQSEIQIVSRIEAMIRRDPGRRGLIGADGDGPGQGELLPAARQLESNSGHVCLVTGFFIPDGSLSEPTALAAGLGPAHVRQGPEASAYGSQVDSGDSKAGGNAETDGPPGTMLLAAVLLDLGYCVHVITDENCSEVVRAAAVATGLESEIVLESPLESTGWRQSFLKSEHASQLSHLIAIERVGPGHTAESVRQQDSAADADAFQSLVPKREQNRCRNMRGEAIDHFSGNLHELFDDVASSPAHNGVQTIGVGDGGNEIGMGRFRWRELCTRLSGEQSATVPCRIATDRTIVAGTSNWGAMALAAAVCVLHDRVDLIDRHTVAAYHDVVRTIVADAGAVDGVTRRREATVDGLPFLTYAQPWSGIRRLLGLGD
jgi:hypothetical protein